MQLRRVVRLSKLERSKALIDTSGGASTASQLTNTARRMLASPIDQTVSGEVVFGRLRIFHQREQKYLRTARYGDS